MWALIAFYTWYACLPAAGPPPRGVISRPADVRLPPPLPPGQLPPPPGPPPTGGGQDGERRPAAAAAAAVISGKSTVVPLPKAHEDKTGEPARPPARVPAYSMCACPFPLPLLPATWNSSVSPEPTATLPLPCPAAVTALVPASVRVRREQAPTRVAAKPVPAAGLAPRPAARQNSTLGCLLLLKIHFLTLNMSTELSACLTAPLCCICFSSSCCRVWPGAAHAAAAAGSGGAGSGSTCIRG
jgi:hypothetical protein